MVRRCSAKKREHPFIPEAVLFAPHGDVDCLKGVVPTAKGLIAVVGKNVDGQKTYTVTVPHGVKVVTELSEEVSVEIVEY